MIIPVILEKDFDVIEERIKSVEQSARLLQIDVADGTITTHTTYTHIQNLNKIHTRAKYEMHLMVKNPLDYIKGDIRDATSYCAQIEAPHTKHFIERCRKYGYKTGLSLALPTDIDILEPYIDLIDYVQFVAVELGEGGHPLNEKIVYDKIKRFREKYPTKELQIDGGILEANFGHLLELGVDNFVIGSAIFTQTFPLVKFIEFKDLENKFRTNILPMDTQITSLTGTDTINLLPETPMATTEIPAAKTIKKIAFLGGSAWKENEQPYKDAFNVAKLLAEHDFEIVNGGGPGVMQAATKGAKAGKGRSLAITYHPNKPKKHYEGTATDNNADEEVYTLDYFDRTKVMLQNTDVHIVFKGSIGTLSEFGMTWVSSWIHEPNSRPIILYGDFWEEILKVLFKNLLISEDEIKMLKICTSPDQVLSYIDSFSK